MTSIDYDIAAFLAKWTSQEQPVEFTAALQKLVEKVQVHGFRLGAKAVGDAAMKHTQQAIDELSQRAKRGIIA